MEQTQVTIPGVGPDIMADPPGLIKCAVAGAHFRTGIFWDKVVAGDPVLLEREPKNQYDPNAVRVLIPGVGHIGYLPRTLAETMSPKLREFEPFTVTVRRVEPKGGKPVPVVFLNIIPQQKAEAL